MQHLRTQVLTVAPASTKIRVALMSTAICDALGGPAEFRPRFSFDFVSSMIPNENFGLGPGVWTDDTSMTLALARSIATLREGDTIGGFDEADQLDAYYRWWKEGELSAINQCFDIGNTIHSALNFYHSALIANGGNGPRHRGPLRKIGEALSPGASAAKQKQQEKQREAAATALALIKDDLSGSVFGGNGSLMRLLPVGLAYYRRPHEVKEFASRSSAVTHPNVVCKEACEVWAALIARVVYCASESTRLTKLDVLHYFASYPYQTPALRTALGAEQPFSAGNTDEVAMEAHYTKHHPVLRLAVETATASSSSSSVDLAERILALLPQAAALRSSGYVVHTITAALYAFLVTTTFEDGALLIANTGDDADTCAAVFGGLAGVWYGEENGAFWTERVRGWHRDLVKKNVIEEIGEELVAFTK
ncbi:ADP-ribosylation/Crystallin J1 [Mycena amicta]|nr:ADP-ribosylation/Crystallin J1 [Mycena amicta]